MLQRSSVFHLHPIWITTEKCSGMQRCMFALNDCPLSQKGISRSKMGAYHGKAGASIKHVICARMIFFIGCIGEARGHF